MSLTGKLRSLRTEELREKRLKRKRISYEYIEIMEHSGPSMFKDPQNLNAPKPELINALLYMIANSETRQIAELFSAALTTLIYYQEGADGASERAAIEAANLETMAPEDMLKLLNSIDPKRLQQLNHAASVEAVRLGDAINAAMEANVLIVPWHIKLWHRLTGKGQFHRAYDGYINFPD